MKRILLVVLLLQLLVIALVGKTFADNLLPATQFVDKETGLVVKADTPENTVVSYYNLFQMGGYKAAFEILTEPSRKAIGDPSMLAYAEKNFNLKAAQLVKVFPAVVEKDIALVGFIRLNNFDGKTETAILGIDVLFKEANRWHVVKTQMSMEQFKQTIDLALKADEKIAGDALEGLTEDQKAQVKNQLIAMAQMHLGTRDNIRLQEEEKKKPKKKSAQSAVYEKVYQQEEPE